MILTIARFLLILLAAAGSATAYVRVRFPATAWVYVPPPPGVFMTLAELQAAIDESRSGGEVVLIDAREPPEYAKGRIAAPTIVNIPADEVDEYLHKMEMFRGWRIMLYCTSVTCDAAERVHERLTRSGFDQMRIYRDGWEGWLAAGGLGEPGQDMYMGMPLDDSGAPAAEPPPDASADGAGGEPEPRPDSESAGSGESP